MTQQKRYMLGMGAEIHQPTPPVTRQNISGGCQPKEFSQ